MKLYQGNNAKYFKDFNHTGFTTKRFGKWPKCPTRTQSCISVSDCLADALNQGYYGHAATCVSKKDKSDVNVIILTMQKVHTER